MTSENLREQFNAIDVDGSGYIDIRELSRALDACGFKIPLYQVRQLIDEVDKDQSGPGKGRLSFDEFDQLCSKLSSDNVATTFKQVVSKRNNLAFLGGMSVASSEGTTHTIRHEEQVAFSNWINSNLGKDPDLKHLLPIDAEGRNLYEKVEDGILLCKIINSSCPDTIDERVINKKNLSVYKKHENLTLALGSAQSIGCNIINIDSSDLAVGKPHLVLGLVWQIIRVGLFNQISLAHCPGLTLLLRKGENIEELMKMSPEAILLRWVNYHLERAGVAVRCNNFTSDITDSEVYTYLMKQIAPKTAQVTVNPLKESNLLNRAEMMLKEAEKLNCRSFVTAKDVVNGVYKLNMAFVANLFNKHPGLDVDPDLDVQVETHEEKTYKNWMNSLGVKPHVNWIYSDLTDGLIIFQLYDIIKPGIVDWSKVKGKFSTKAGFLERLENCNYAVNLGKQLKFSLVGISGKDINDGNRTLTLALVWQLMKAYTLSILTQLASSGNPIVEKEIISWVNSKLAEGGKSTSIKGFNDPSIATAEVVLDLIDCIRPGIVDYELVKLNGLHEDNLDNAKYAISTARKIGARVYALPEDISQVKMKMVMTVFATLMARDYIPHTDIGPILN